MWRWWTATTVGGLPTKLTPPFQKRCRPGVVGAKMHWGWEGVETDEVGGYF